MTTDNATSSSIQTRQAPLYQRHRRAPSIPLRVRSTSLGRNNGSANIHDDGIIATLSPSNADIPFADPSLRSATAPNGGTSSSFPTTTSSDPDQGILLDKHRHAALPQKASEKYGFVVYVGSLLAWYLFLFWAFTPGRYIKALGIEWYPNRQWALLVPSWLMMTVVYVYIAYFALNFYYAPSLSSLSSITDTQGRFHPLATHQFEGAQTQSSFLKATGSTGSQHEIDYIPPLFDLPPYLVQSTAYTADL